MLQYKCQPSFELSTVNAEIMGNCSRTMMILYWNMTDYFGSACKSNCVMSYRIDDEIGDTDAVLFLKIDVQVRAISHTIFWQNIILPKDHGFADWKWWILY